MREILFRGKRIDNGEWETGSLVYARMGTSEEQASIADKMTAYHTPVIPETVGQYTGLTDKNGRKIFEGDIIHGNLGNFVVRWSDNISGFVAGEKERTHPCLNRGTMKCYEVVGNIHDNPELLGSNIHKAETAESE